MPTLTLHRISKTFDENGIRTLALEDVSFAVQPGEFVTMIGPSGSGKSTVFNLITGLLRPDHGEIALNGDVINGRTG
ncbi:MAG TPA: ATP-binding cassette domain-containing protein, partial [Aggregatilineales bacterium]|nr:ATP-binding cassette domain-containing protein [Aggregatilineales bacterium]